MATTGVFNTTTGPSDSKQGYYLGRPLWNPFVSQANFRPFQSKYTDKGVELYSEGIISDPGAVDQHTGKPLYTTQTLNKNPNGSDVFDASQTRLATSVNEKPMSDVESYNWRKFQLFRTLLKIERRDTVHEALSSSEYWGGRATHHWLGTPFPMIEPNPFMGEAMFAVRWYEHMFAMGAAILSHQRAASTPSVRFSGKGVGYANFASAFLVFEMCFMYRSIWRLTGQAPNEPECYKYGVYETPARLQQKAERWRKYANYKEEWMRRWNYYIWGMRPGEENTWISACWFGHWKVRYNTKTDYPVRKNPYKVSMRSVRDMQMLTKTEGGYEKGVDSYLTRCRPEFQHMWDGGVG